MDSCEKKRRIHGAQIAGMAISASSFDLPTAYYIVTFLDYIEPKRSAIVQNSEDESESSKP